MCARTTVGTAGRGEDTASDCSSSDELLQLDSVVVGISSFNIMQGAPTSISSNEGYELAMKRHPAAPCYGVQHIHEAGSRIGEDSSVSIEGNLNDHSSCVQGQHGQPTRVYAAGKGSRFGATFNVVNTIVGAGIIGLPYALRQCGLVAGVVLMPFAAYVCKGSSLLLIQTGTMVGRLNYEELMELLYGPAGYHAFCFFSFVMSFGAMLSYLIILGDIIPDVVTHAGGEGMWADRNSVILMCSVLFILPLASCRGLHHLQFSSFLSAMADVVLIIIIIYAGPSAAKNEYTPHEINPRATVIEPTVVAGFGVISFAYVSQSSSFLIYRSLKNRTESSWRVVVHASMTIALLLGMVFALSGYLIFGQETEGDVLNNLPTNSTSASIARGFLALTMVLTYPMEMFVSRHVIDASICQRLLQWGEINTLRHYSWTLLIWAATVALALMTANLGVVLEIFGAFAASALGYVMPAMMYLRANYAEIKNDLAVWDKTNQERYQPRLLDRLKTMRRWLHGVGLLGFGLAAMLVGTVSSMVNLHS